MSITREAVDERTRLVAVTGELVGSVGGDLIRTIDEQVAEGVGRVVVDLTDLTFLDSGGLAALLGGWQVLHRAQIEFVLVVPEQAHLRRTFEARGVGDLFAVVPTREEAIAWSPGRES